jgi:hypothetical protein
LSNSEDKSKAPLKSDPKHDILVPPWMSPFLPYDVGMRDIIMFALWFCIIFIVGSLFALLDYQMLAIGTLVVGNSFIWTHYILRQFYRKRS